MKHFLGTILLLLAFTIAHAVEPDEILQNPKLEQRARDISKQLRCVVCQNQSIDDSDADLAKDLRLIVREKLSEGKTDAEIFTYLIERYGAFILLKPQLRWNTVMLWATPIVLLIIGVLAILMSFRRYELKSVEEKLTEKQLARIKEITKM
jgi:cytochrome c-type biogenesis protein CcmH